MKKTIATTILLAATVAFASAANAQNLTPANNHPQGGNNQRTAPANHQVSNGGDSRQAHGNNNQGYAQGAPRVIATNRSYGYDNRNWNSGWRAPYIAPRVIVRGGWYPSYAYWPYGGYYGYGYPAAATVAVADSVIYANSEAPGYTLGGAVLGGVVGGIIGNNSGWRNGWAGAAIGSVIGAAAGSIAGNAAVREQRAANVQAAQQNAYYQNAAVQQQAPAQQQPQNVTIINNYYNNGTPMGQANAMFGR